MAVWSKALPLTASCLSPLSGFVSLPGHARKLPVTVRLGVGFRQVLQFPPLVSTGWSLLSHNMAEKVMKN